jgi:hypothetical protein
VKNVYIKLFIGLVLFGSLVALTVLQVPHADRLIDLIYAALVGLGIYHLGDRDPAPPPDKQSGNALPGLLGVLALGSALALAGCGTAAVVTPAPISPQVMQTAFVDGCAAWNVAFSTAYQLRLAGKLNQAQIDQVTLLDSQITPLCTGPLPTDATNATQQVTAAVASMAILEAIHKEQ